MLEAREVVAVTVVHTAAGTRLHDAVSHFSTQGLNDRDTATLMVRHTLQKTDYTSILLDSTRLSENTTVLCQESIEE